LAPSVKQNKGERRAGVVLLKQAMKQGILELPSAKVG
jgi:hypothetical protein